MINFLMRIWTFIFGEAVIWGPTLIDETDNYGKEMWFHDPELEQITGVKGPFVGTCGLHLWDDQGVVKVLVWIDRLPNGEDYCGHEYVPVSNVIGTEEPVNEEKAQ